MFGASGTIGTQSIIPKSTIRVEIQTDDRRIAVQEAAWSVGFWFPVGVITCVGINIVINIEATCAIL